MRDKAETVALGVKVSIIAGLLMGAFAPFVTGALTQGHPLTPYSTAVVFSLGALACCFVFNVYLMRRPLRGDPVPLRGYWAGGARNHMLGLHGGVIWGPAAASISSPLAWSACRFPTRSGSPLLSSQPAGASLSGASSTAPANQHGALAIMALSYVTAILLLALAYDF